MSVSSLESAALGEGSERPFQSKDDRKTSKGPLSTNSEDSEKEDRPKRKQALKEKIRATDNLSAEQKQIYGMLDLKKNNHEQIMDLFSQAKSQELFKKL